jgi:hypothetical protein
MRVCNGDISYACSKLKTYIVEATRCIEFDIFDAVSPDDVKDLFTDNVFYFYDEIDGRLPDTDNTKLVGLRIFYDADSTCKIRIKLTKGVVDVES